MTDLTDADIDRIARGVMNRSLPKPEWTHAAHFAAALWLLRDRGEAAFAEMPDAIRRYNEATGVPNTDHDGYHETITLASLRLANNALKTAGAGAPLSSILKNLLAGPAGRSGWILEYWSPEALFSVRARREWAPPDRQPMPW